MLIDTLYGKLQSLGGEVRYGQRATALEREGDGFVVVTQGEDGTIRHHACTVVLGCGGFEASPHMRAAYLGPGWGRRCAVHPTTRATAS